MSEMTSGLVGRIAAADKDSKMHDLNFAIGRHSMWQLAPKPSFLKRLASLLL